MSVRILSGVGRKRGPPGFSRTFAPLLPDCRGKSFGKGSGRGLRGRGLARVLAPSRAVRVGVAPAQRQPRALVVQQVQCVERGTHRLPQVAESISFPGPDQSVAVNQTLKYCFYFVGFETRPERSSESDIKILFLFCCFSFDQDCLLRRYMQNFIRSSIFV